ncbi:hypothetical protein K431DRAFT_76270 [Polychaeton citri CBS 116435]|uniref:Rho1 guanine nucleotide exchange factor 3 n=1 Tax=Polychaeton citri CBS 116435 TaxID=1314669 RepID=A0A9P4UQ42_9PEZI|nr:hypothetical protein K431DRAFT_76270 [Polychaeton citri CBS 116435]
MSYYGQQSGQYGGPQGYGQDQYGQYGQNGYQQGAPAYPGQYGYAHPQQPYQDQSQANGGPVQQPYGGAGYGSPQMTHPGQTYGYQQPQQTYNPQAYASPQQQQQSTQPQSYNPAAYANTSTSPSFASYNPSSFSSNSGPVDPWAYQQAAYSPNPQAQSPALGSGYTQSPHQTQQAWSPSPPQPTQFPSYTQSAPPQQHTYSYTQPSSSPPISTHTAMPYPEQFHPTQQRQNSVQSRSFGSNPSVSPALPGLSDPGTLPSPPTYNTLSERQSPSPLYQPASHPSFSPPISDNNTPGPTPPIHRSDTIGRHPTGRPLPGAPQPEDSYFSQRQLSDGRRLTLEEMNAQSQEELFRSVEDAVNGMAPDTGLARSPSISVSHPTEPSHSPQPLFGSGSVRGRNQSNGQINGHLSPHPPNEAYSDESDAEAAAGVAAMRMEDERDAAEEARRRSSGMSGVFGHNYSGSFSSQRDIRPQESQSEQATIQGGSDSDGYAVPIDMTQFAGGFDAGMSYGGNDPTLLMRSTSGREINGVNHSLSLSSHGVSSQTSSLRRSHPSQSSNQGFEYDQVQGFPTFQPAAAQVDAGAGTGGLNQPGRRQSYDEGDDLLEDQLGHLPERFPDEPPDIPFQTASRPLPPPPVSDELTVPRSTSLISHSNREQVPQPLRSKTDAEERRIRAQQSAGYRTSQMYDLRSFDSKLMDSRASSSPYDSTPASASNVAIDLPSLPTRRFVPSKLGAPEFKKCVEPWALRGILAWLRDVTLPDQATELYEVAVKEALVALFTNKVPTMNIADAETLSARVVTDMYQAGTLIKTEEWVKIVPGPMCGVIFQLTGAGCYAPTVHDHIVPGRCYSHHCQRTLKKVNLQTAPKRSGETWAEFYKLKKEDLEGRDKKQIEIQNNLHEIVQTEDVYTEQLMVLRTLYRDPLKASDILTPKRRDKFLQDVFGRVEAVKQANEDHLLPQLKYRQQEQGPWIVGFSDIFRQWIRKAKTAYIDYAGAFPGATFLVRQELEKNIHFANFIEQARSNVRGGRLGWDTFLKAPITRLQRYTLLLQTVLKNMKVDSEERKNLTKALEEVRSVTHECDTRVAEMQRHVDLTDLGNKLVLRPGMQNVVELNLNHLGRELIHRGDLQRMGGNRFTWLDCHTILFDHYLVLAKTVAQRAEQGGKLEKYDVSRLPIPMDLLILESTNDPAVQKSSYVKGITSVTTVSTAGGRGSATDNGVLGRTTSGQSLQHVNTGGSSMSTHTVTALTPDKENDKIMYPFKIKHLGRDTYTLFAPTEQARRDWVVKITEAKTKHARSLFAQHAEPFRLNVMADSAFVYDGFANNLGRSVVIQGTPVDRAIKDVEERFRETGRPGPICRARVNCATTFTLTDGKAMCAVGTDFGVFISEMGNPRGWTRAINMTRVTQVAVLEEFNLFLLISDKSLIAYHLDIIYSASGSTSSTAESARKAAQKLSGSRDVGFFVTGRMKDRTLVFYKKRENLSSTFKVLEPIFQKSTEKKRSFLKRGTTDFFREYDEFYIPAECTGINLFHSSLAVSTARGFEVLTLDKKQPWTVPDLKAPHVQDIATHVKDQKALCMLRLSDQEFLLCYQNCAVYVNKHGEVSRSVIMEFVGNAQTAALYGAYLILFDNDFVEIRNAQNGRLKQIIAGREIKCLDDGGSTINLRGAANGATGNGLPVYSQSPTVKLVMQHPELERTQIVAELLLNEGMKDG